MKFQLIIDMVKAAGDILRERKINSIIMKGRADYVTDVDIFIQNYLKSKLKRAYPDISFFSEEMNLNSIEENVTTWILDPVDGTTNLIHGYNHSAISLALVVQGEIILGIIYDPFRKELFYAKKGEGAYLNGVRIHVAMKTELSESLLAVGTAPHNKIYAEDNFRLFCKLFLHAQDIRRSGSAALDLAYVACGRVDAFIEKDLKIWDFAAGAILVVESGGVIGDWNKNTLKLQLKSDILAANCFLHTLIVGKMNMLK